VPSSVQVTLEERDLGGGHDGGVDVVGTELAGGSEVGAHGALGVGRDQDQAPAGGRPLGGRPPLEGDADGPDVVGEDRAELVVAHPPHEGTPPAERGQPRQRVGGRSAGDLHARAHRRVQRVGPLGVDQLHRALHQTVAIEEAVVGVGDHVDEGVADADDVERFLHGASREQRRVRRT
jgi:hypothetical protein